MKSEDSEAERWIAAFLLVCLGVAAVWGMVIFKNNQMKMNEPSERLERDNIPRLEQQGPDLPTMMFDKCHLKKLIAECEQIKKSGDKDNLYSICINNIGFRSLTSTWKIKPECRSEGESW